MAETFLEEIYKDALLITELKKIVEYSYYHEVHNVYAKYNKIVSSLVNICRKFAKIDPIKAKKLFNTLETVSGAESNEILMGDIIQKKVIPLLENYMEMMGAIKVMNEEEDYKFESSESGFLTIKNMEQNHYYHSTDDPMWEARRHAKHIYDPKKKEYVVWGCGLGYMIYQLYDVSYGSIKITVFEQDERIIEYARNYGVLDWIPEENVSIIIDKDIQSFLKYMEQKDVGMYIFTPELRCLPENELWIMANLHAEKNTINLFKETLEINFWRNLDNESKLVSQFDCSKLKKEFVVVAAGPSLDDTLDFVEQSKGKRTIVAVGTVFKKLIERNIVPDIVVILDPQERTYQQIVGVEDEKVPMLIGITAYWKFAASYQGEKYLVPLAHIPEVVEYAIKNKIDTWSCGGTVTSLGIETAIRFGAETIYLVGVDLAYPGGVSHASNTMDRELKKTEGMPIVEDVNGNEVYTSRAFLLYKEWIEDRIRETSHIKYYNVSDVGAKIDGAEKWQ